MDLKDGGFILGSILDHFWTHLGLLGYLGDSKWTSKRSWKVFWTLPDARLEKIMKKVISGDPGGRVIDRGLMGHPQVLDTWGPLGRVPACTGAHFNEFLNLLFPVGTT